MRFPQTGFGEAMGSFSKGMIFTMGGAEYEVLAEGTNEPSSDIVYAPASERDTSEPFTMSSWKAEAKLARGDILINGYSADKLGEKEVFYPRVIDPLEQIAELKKRIRAIERRRLSLLKADDPRGRVLLQDNVVRPNKPFDIWEYTRTSGDIAKRERKIQYVKIRGVMLIISGQSGHTERFLFNIGDQLQPLCRVSGDTLTSEGKIKIDLTSHMRTSRGGRTKIITDDIGGRIELGVELRLNCKVTTGLASVNAKITQAAYIRDVNAPGLKIGRVAFSELGDYFIAIEGVGLDIYTDGPDN